MLLPEPGKVSSIAVAAEPGVSQAELVDRLEAVLPDGVEAITGAELTAELEEETQGEDHETLQQALILFAVVALVVATFTIHNTFSILVAQRTRESALLRALGASRGQVLRSITAEALAVGLVGSVAGIAAGLVLALGLLALMDASGLATPASPLVVDAATVAAALAVGVVVTLLASLAPAVRASRVAPLAALRDVAVDRSATSRRRAVVGAVVTGAGVVLTIAGATGEALVLAGLGSLATLVGVVVLGPVAARPAAVVLGAPQAAWGGVSGELARRNALRNPRRTAAPPRAHDRRGGGVAVHRHGRIAHAVDRQRGRRAVHRRPADHRRRRRWPQHRPRRRGRRAARGRGGLAPRRRTRAHRRREHARQCHRPRHHRVGRRPRRPAGIAARPPARRGGHVGRLRRRAPPGSWATR